MYIYIHYILHHINLLGCGHYHPDQPRALAAAPAQRLEGGHYYSSSKNLNNLTNL